MENVRQIEQLIEKYYNGETSLEEERKLQWYFQTQEVPERFQADKKLFDHYYHRKREEPVPGLTERLSGLIDEQEPGGGPLISGRFLRWAGSAAAVIVIILAIWLGRGDGMQQQAYHFEDTYEDPELAYLETKRALLLVSEKMNAGTRKLESLNYLNDGVKNLAPVFSIGPGIQHLEKLSKFNESIELISK